MAHQRKRHGSDIASFALGVFLTSYLHRRRHLPEPVVRNTPLRGLDARQAMTAVAFGRIVGLIAMGVFLGYYVYTMSSL